MKDNNDDKEGGCIDLEWRWKMGCIDLQWWWWWCRYLSTPSADASRKYTSSDTTERMNTQKTCEFGSYCWLTVLFSSQHNFTHMKQIQNCIFYQYFASPSLTRDQFACPVFCLQTRIFCHKYILDCKPEYFVTKIFFSANIIWWWVVLPSSWNIFFTILFVREQQHLVMNIVACKIVK